MQYQTWQLVDAVTAMAMQAAALLLVMGGLCVTVSTIRLEITVRNARLFLTTVHGSLLARRLPTNVWVSLHSYNYL